VGIGGTPYSQTHRVEGGKAKVLGEELLQTALGKMGGGRGQEEGHQVGDKRAGPLRQQRLLHRHKGIHDGMWAGL